MGKGSNGSWNKRNITKYNAGNKNEDNLNKNGRSGSCESKF